MSMNPYDYFGSYGGYGGYSANFPIVPIFIISAVLAGLLAVLFLPRRNQGRFSPVLNRIYDFLSFRIYWLPWIIKVTFLVLAIFLFAMGLYVMFTLSFVVGLILMLCVFFVRLSYETVFALYSIRNNVEEMNRRMGGAPAPESDETPFRPAAPRTGGGFSFRDFAQHGPQRQEQTDKAAPAYEPIPTEQIKSPEPEVPSCANCGAELRPGAMFCANCGARVK